MNQLQRHSLTSSKSSEAPSILRGDRRPDLIRDEVLADIFKQTLKASPHATAIIENDQRFSFQQVDQISDKMASALHQHGFGTGDVIGLCMNRGAHLIMMQLAITKLAATWLPLDEKTPSARIKDCLTDAKAKCLIISHSSKEAFQDLEIPQFTDLDLMNAGLVIDFQVLPMNLNFDSQAYIIYTSGSSGSPKGVSVSHRNVCHYLRAANEVFKFQSSDVVFQGTSPAFDLSVEEIWLSFLVGACLVVATQDDLLDSEKMIGLIHKYQITVMDTVPTLASQLNQDTPSLRMLILGGEVLNPTLARRLAQPGRLIFNCYGPTETTIGATSAQIFPKHEITIGGPLPNYTCYVVSPETLTLVSCGEKGELLIGGPSVCDGYLHRPELSLEKFISNPFISDGSDPRLYRTGDEVFIDQNGQICFCGRLDQQVKIRGFRIELGDIESALARLENISSCAVVSRSNHGSDQLIAFMVPDEDFHLDSGQIRRQLEKSLPSYMVPHHFEFLKSLPQFSSGKINRSALQSIRLKTLEAPTAVVPETPHENCLLKATQLIFSLQTISVEADFFNDLGGHSLLASQLVSEARKDPRTSALNLQDVYELRTLRKMAAALEHRAPILRQNLSFSEPSLRRRFLCGSAQAVALSLILFLQTVQWLGMFVGFLLLPAHESGFGIELLKMLGLYIGLTFLTGAIGLLGKWLAIGKTKPGVYPLWGVYYFRWWLATRFISLIKLKWMQNTPLMNITLRLLGAKVGNESIISEFEAGALDLVNIGNRVVSGAKVKFANAEVIGDCLYIGPIKIKDDAVLGTSALISRGCVVGSASEVGDLSMVPVGAEIPDREVWKGSPAKKTGVRNKPSRAPKISFLRDKAINLFYGLSFILAPGIGFLPIFPAFWMIDHMEFFISDFNKNKTLQLLPFLAAPAAIVLTLATLMLVVALRWIIFPRRLKAGTYPIHSAIFLRKWLLGLVTEVNLDTISSLFSTLYICPWYRLMGAKIGRGTEVCSHLNSNYDLIQLGNHNFVADDVFIGDENIREGTMTITRILTGDRVFLGNDSVLPFGAIFGDDSLLGVKSLAPEDRPVKKQEIWFGSPALLFPQRQKVSAEARWTFSPSPQRKMMRALFELVAISIPNMLYITFGYFSVAMFEKFLMQQQFWGAAAVFAGAACVIPLLMISTAIATKWALMGSYKSCRHPMWSWWALRNQVTTALYWSMAGKSHLEPFRGTPFLPWFLRLFGAKIGRGVFLNSTDMTEFDCVKIGDFATLNPMTGLQTHLYEDRVMKVGFIEIGKGVSIGTGSTVLYDTVISDFAQLDGLTVVMKGERLPSHTSWMGAPARSREESIGS